MNRILSVLYTVFLCTATMGFLFVTMVSLFTILLGILGRDYEALGVGIAAVVVFSFATLKVGNKFIDRMEPPPDVNWQ